MLRLALAARTRLLRAGAVRAAGALVPAWSRLSVQEPASPFLRCYDAPRFLSSDAEDRDGRWKTLAVNNPVAWQEAVKPSLLTFLKIKKHLMVPAAFVVPRGDDAWPRAAWGYPLGKHAAWLRKQWREGGRGIDPTQRKELDEMPFAWDWSQHKWDLFLLPALRRYFELNGHTDVATDFRIPKESPEWPEHLRGYFLGRKVLNIRNRDDYAKQVEADQDELERLHFCHDSTLIDRNWREKVESALTVFRQEFGHCNVNSAFVVPSQSPWPESTWGMRLGITVQNIRRGDFGRYKRELDELGFVWDNSESEWSERIIPAFETFYRLHGHCRVPASFVVPSDENWPEQSRGLNLGNVVGGIRSHSTYSTQVLRDKARLEQFGFVWDFFEAEWNKRILPSFATFYRLHGHCRVPESFVVPSEASWPKEVHGLKLGFVLKNFRQHATYFDQVARAMDSLGAIDFDSRIADSRWGERVEPLLATFEQLHGRRNVPRDFVVPSSSPWEEKDWGVQLGKLEQREPPRAEVAS